MRMSKKEWPAQPSIPERITDCVFNWGVCLPLQLAEGRGRVWRLACLLSFFIWCIPAMVVLAIPLLVGMFWAIIDDFVFREDGSEQ